MKKEDEASLRDTGVEPYLYGDYKGWAGKTSEQLKYREMPEKESQFKKPYIKFDHVKSEREFAGPETWIPMIPDGPGPPGPWEPPPWEPPSWPPWVPWPPPPPQVPGPTGPVPGLPPGPLPGPGPGGGGTTITPLEPCENCAILSFPDRYYIYKVSITEGTGWVASTYNDGDSRLAVKVCWSEDAGRVYVSANYDGFRDWQVLTISVDKNSCICQDRTDPDGCKTCTDCTALSIGYTTQQMSCNGTQLLSAVGGGGCYKWTITSGGGTLSDSAGLTTTYTAPSSNAECVNNPTIQLEDFCKSATTLKLAVNCAGPGGIAYKIIVDTATAQCSVRIHLLTYNCAGTFDTEISCDGCDYSGSCPPCCANCCNWDAGVGRCRTDLFCCTQAAVIARCSGVCLNCVLGTYDLRTAEQKTAGCCPAALL